jgi:hypothetical protein
MIESTTYGQKGGEGPTRGRKATFYLVALPNGTTQKKRTFSQPVEPCGFAYQHDGKWFVAGVCEDTDPRMQHYTKCPAAIAVFIK